MSFSFYFKRVLNGLNIIPKSSTTSQGLGDMEVLSSTNKGYFHNGSSNSPLVTEAHTATLTNKSMDGDDNTFTNIPSGALPADVVYTTASQTLTNKTLTTPIISTISNTGTLTLPTSTDTLVGKATTDTLTNKTLTSPVVNTPTLNGSGGQLTLPAGPDTLVGRATTDTLTNKTLTSPVIATIVNSGTLTLPTSTDTLVGKATTDTLTNKTMSGSSNTFSNIGYSSLNLTASVVAADLNSQAASNGQTLLANGSGGATWGPAGAPAYDNITIDLNGSSQLEVKTAGISATQLASNAVTTAKILNGNVTPAKQSTQNFATVDFTGTTTGSTSPVAVTGASLALAVSGQRQVAIHVTSRQGTTANPGYVNVFSTDGRAAGMVIIQKNGTTLRAVRLGDVFGSATAVSNATAFPLNFTFYDNPSVGTPTYEVFITNIAVGSGQTFAMSDGTLQIIEL